MKTFIDTINFGVKNWWVSLLLGLLYILIAICLMFTPLASYIALSVLFSVSMFVSGTLEILFAITNKKNISSWRPLQRDHRRVQPAHQPRQGI